jgi:hypothetical protein
MLWLCKIRRRNGNERRTIYHALGSSDLYAVRNAVRLAYGYNHSCLNCTYEDVADIPPESEETWIRIFCRPAIALREQRNRVIVNECIRELTDQWLRATIAEFVPEISLDNL